MSLKDQEIGPAAHMQCKLRSVPANYKNVYYCPVINPSKRSQIINEIIII